MADSLHLLAASLWVGGLLAMAIALVPLPPREQRAELPTVIKAGWKPFSIIAVLCVPILFATGFYNTGRQVASADALLTTFYGQALITKVSAVLLVGAIGLLSSMLLHPRLAAPLARVLRRPSGWTPLPLRKLPTLVIVEVSLGLIVLLITGVVTSSATPRGIEYAVDPQEIPSALSQTVDDLVITLNAKPNRPGQNVFNVFARSTRKPAPAEIGRVLLRFEYLGRDVGRKTATAEQVASDRFILSGNHLNLGGEWQVQVVVRRLGLEDSVATFNWVVAPAGDVRPTVVSRASLEPVLT
jgi:copper transport protein